MADQQAADSYLRKAEESLLGAESEYLTGRFNNCANRAYYACFQTAIAALLRDGLRDSHSQWAHSFVQSRFVGQLVNRRHRYPTALQGTLADLLVTRQNADYEPGSIKRSDATSALRRSRQFVEAIRTEGDRAQ